MFSAIKSEITNRILQIEVFFNALHGSSVTIPPGSTPPLVPGSATARGLVFVSLYGTWEYTVSTAVEAAIQELKKLPLSDVRLELLGLLLHWECDAAAKSNRDKMWDKRIHLFQQTVSLSPFVGDPPFPSDGTQYRETQLQTVWKLFGIKESTVPDRRLLGRIEEMIENRNIIAHGERTAENIGCRYSVDDIRSIIAAIQTLCLHVTGTLETHCSTTSNLSR